MADRPTGPVVRFWHRILVLALGLATLAGMSARLQAEQGSALAVVVHADVGVDNLTTAELRRLLLGDREFWPSGERVTILIRTPVARERDVIVKTICEMTEAQFRKHWIGKVFRAETPRAPQIVSSEQLAIAQVQATPGALTVIAASGVQAGMKVLSIDGRRPGDAGYPFR